MKPFDAIWISWLLIALIAFIAPHPHEMDYFPALLFGGAVLVATIAHVEEK